MAKVHDEDEEMKTEADISIYFFEELALTRERIEAGGKGLCTEAAPPPPAAPPPAAGEDLSFFAGGCCAAPPNAAAELVRALEGGGGGATALGLILSLSAKR
jgi:hypothetical protein